MVAKNPTATDAVQWQPLFVLRVDGKPVGQPRARASSRGGYVRMYDPGTADGWKSCINAAWLQLHPRPRQPLDGPVRVDISFLFPRPQRLMTRKSPDGRVLHIAKPDRDNSEKAVLDAMTDAGVWLDDAQVCAGEVAKFYHAKDEQPGAIIMVSVSPGGAGGAGRKAQ